jgi:hypothetical protein
MKIELILIILSIVFISIGNLMDVTETDKFLLISKYSYWNNGIFLLLLTMILYFYKKNKLYLNKSQK